jgi:sec-independent protein translocase protein TatA
MMGGVSIWHWIVVGVVVMLLFGRGKISELMGDVAKGIKSFKKGMSDDETETAAAKPAEPAKIIEDQRAPGVQAPAGERKAS